MSMGWFNIAFFGGGFALGFVLLGFASFTRPSVARTLCIASFVPVIAQCGLWLYIWAIANSCCGHGGQSTSIVPWVVFSLIGLASGVTLNAQAHGQSVSWAA